MVMSWGLGDALGTSYGEVVHYGTTLGTSGWKEFCKEWHPAPAHHTQNSFPPLRSNIHNSKANLGTYGQDFSAYPGPGCEPSPGPPRTTSCSLPRACSSLQGKGVSVPTGCASPTCNQHRCCGRAFQANREGLAFRGRLGEKRKDQQCCRSRKDSG